MGTMEETLQRLHHAAFRRGLHTGLADVLRSLVELPDPDALGVPVRFWVHTHAVTAHPACPVTGLPPGEAPLRPLLEALSVDNALLLFLAVLLERRVLLRCRQYRMLTLASEGVRQLLYPLRCRRHIYLFLHPGYDILFPFRLLNVYIPVMPSELVDYIEAPMPFLMGMHPDIDLEGRSTEHVVVVDLDRCELGWEASTMP